MSRFQLLSDNQWGMIADLLPGPVRVTISVGSHARETFDVIVPESGPASLASLVEDAVEWSPV